jgi:hypothetical protein
MKKPLLLSIVLCCYVASINAQINEVASQSVAPATSISFEQTEFNFGIVAQGEKVKNVFVFTNTGSQPLIISDAKGSCGCTVPEWPREAIMPGKSAHILAVFDSANKLGLQAKRITITANTSPIQVFLILKGEVVASKSEVAKNEFKNVSVNEHLFTMYPIPASNKVTLKFNSVDNQKTRIEVFDNSGKLILTENKIISEMNTSVDLDLVGFAPGVYTASVAYGDKMRLAKQFVVQ